MSNQNDFGESLHITVIFCTILGTQRAQQYLQRNSATTSQVRINNKNYQQNYTREHRTRISPGMSLLLFSSVSCHICRQFCVSSYKTGVLSELMLPEQFICKCTVTLKYLDLEYDIN